MSTTRLTLKMLRAIKDMAAIATAACPGGDYAEDSLALSEAERVRDWADDQIEKRTSKPATAPRQPEEA